MKEVTCNVSKTVDTLLRLEKEKSVLSKNLEQCTTEIAFAQEQLTKAGLRIKAHQNLAAKLKKRCDRATTVKANAVKRAIDQARKEHTTHHLLSKGVYTEKTQSLIRVLVKAGCSQEQVGQVITAVFKTAGISAKGDVSQ